VPPLEFRPVVPRSFGARVALVTEPTRELFLAGTPTDAPRVGIVGTREATPDALKFAAELAGIAAQAGVVVVSGGALGIDGAAHVGALDAGGITWLVSPSATDNPTPKEHVGLYDRVVASGGCVWTLFRAGTKTTNPHYHRRNALLAALTPVIVVVQAGIPSGTLSTARAARRLGRRVYAPHGAPWDERMAGNRELLRRAWAIPLESSKAFAEIVASFRAPPKPRLNVPLEQRIVQTLRSGPRHVDELVVRTGASAADLRMALLTLELDGLVQAVAAERFAAR
jgi:DNA processing protein